MLILGEKETVSEQRVVVVVEPPKFLISGSIFQENIASECGIGVVANSLSSKLDSEAAFASL